jgi:hypothetical protein
MREDMGKACSTLGTKKTEGKRPLGRPRRVWENSIKINFKEIRCEDIEGFIWLRIVTSGGLL